MDDEGYPQALFVDRVVVLVEVVLSEPLAVVAVEGEDGVLVEPQLLVLLDQVADVEVQVSYGVLVAIESLFLGKFPGPVPRDRTVVVVSLNE